MTAKPPKNGLKDYAALNLIAFGVGWLLFAGLCSAAFVPFVGLELVLYVGLPSALFGAALYGLGTWLSR